MTTYSLMHDEDLHRVMQNIPADVRALMRKYNLFVGGGMIRSLIAGEPVSDIDLFGQTVDILQKAALEIALSRKAQIHKTDNAWTIICPPRAALQFIQRWVFLDINSVVESFDFTVCQAAVGWERMDGADHRWVGLVADNFYRDLAGRRLVYTFPVRDEDAGGSMLRVRKFLMRGYNIQINSLAGVIARLMKGLEDSAFVGSPEGVKATILMARLREVDPLVLVDGLDVIDEHEKIT